MDVPGPILHSTQGDSAGGVVRMACRDHGIPGTVLVIPEDLSHGPLNDGPARIAYMRACHMGFDVWHHTITDAFAPWRDLITLLDHDRPGALVIWAGDNVSEAVFLAMTCAWLAGRPEPLFRVAPSDPSRSSYAAVYKPAEVAPFFHARQALTDSQRTAYAQDFVRIRDQPGTLRRWEDNRVIGVPVARYDPLLLAACGPEWKPATQIVGAAMVACDPGNLLSDLFFSARLRALIQAGRLTAKGPGQTLRDYAVRSAD